MWLSWVYIIFVNWVLMVAIVPFVLSAWALWWDCEPATQFQASNNWRCSWIQATPPQGIRITSRRPGWRGWCHMVCPTQWIGSLSWPPCGSVGCEPLLSPTPAAWEAQGNSFWSWDLVETLQSTVSFFISNITTNRHVHGCMIHTAFFVQTLWIFLVVGNLWSRVQRH